MGFHVPGNGEIAHLQGTRGGGGWGFILVLVPREEMREVRRGKRISPRWKSSGRVPFRERARGRVGFEVVHSF